MCCTGLPGPGTQDRGGAGAVARSAHCSTHLVPRLQVQVAHDGAGKAGGRPAAGQALGKRMGLAGAAAAQAAAAVGKAARRPPCQPCLPVLKALEPLKVLARRGARWGRRQRAGNRLRRHTAAGAAGCGAARRPRDRRPTGAPAGRGPSAGRRSHATRRLQHSNAGHLRCCELSKPCWRRCTAGSGRLRHPLGGRQMMGFSCQALTSLATLPALFVRQLKLPAGRATSPALPAPRAMAVDAPQGPAMDPTLLERFDRCHAGCRKRPPRRCARQQRPPPPPTGARHPPSLPLRLL